MTCIPLIHGVKLILTLMDSYHWPLSQLIQITIRNDGGHLDNAVLFGDETRHF